MSYEQGIVFLSGYVGTYVCPKIISLPFPVTGKMYPHNMSREIDPSPFSSSIFSCIFDNFGPRRVSDQRDPKTVFGVNFV